MSDKEQSKNTRKLKRELISIQLKLQDKAPEVIANTLAVKCENFLADIQKKYEDQVIKNKELENTVNKLIVVNKELNQNRHAINEEFEDKLTTAKQDFEKKLEVALSLPATPEDVAFSQRKNDEGFLEYLTRTVRLGRDNQLDEIGIVINPDAIARWVAFEKTFDNLMDNISEAVSLNKQVTK